MVEIFDNIRKIYTFTQACPELAEHIEFFSESSAECTRRYIGHSNFSVKMFPSWTPTFYFNLGAPYLISVGRRQHHINAHQDILILRDSIVERFNTPSKLQLNAVQMLHLLYGYYWRGRLTFQVGFH